MRSFAFAAASEDEVVISGFESSFVLLEVAFDSSFFGATSSTGSSVAFVLRFFAGGMLV